VRVLDPRWPMFSQEDDPSLRSLAPVSRVDAIQLVGTPAAPPPSLFGPEPERSWCYYFERAAAASQRGDWQQVAALQEQAGRLGLQPNDQIEWMPFLQAQAYLGNLQLKDISRANTDSTTSCRRVNCLAC
jgi:hypothetical protein